MEAVTSRHNARVKRAASLLDRRARTASGRHLADAPSVVRAALEAGLVDELLGTSAGLEALEVDAPAGVTRTVLDERVLRRITDVVTPQGVVAVVRTRTRTLADVVGAGVLVVADRLADPGNLGTVVRTADAAGAAAVVSTAGSTDVFGPKAVRAAAGSTYTVPIVTGITLDEVVTACRAAGQEIFALDARATAEVWELERRTAPVALVLGNEAHGLDEATLGRLDGAVAVPMRGGAESLNVAIAGAVAIYAAARAEGERGAR